MKNLQTYKVFLSDSETFASRRTIRIAREGRHWRLLERILHILINHGTSSVWPWVSSLLLAISCFLPACVFGPPVDEAVELDSPPHIEKTQPEMLEVSFNLSEPESSRNFRATEVLDFDLPDGLGLRARFSLQLGDNPPIVNAFSEMQLQPVQDDETRLAYTSHRFTLIPCENPDIANGVRTGHVMLEVVDPIPGELQRHPEHTQWTVVHTWILRFEGQCPETPPL